MGERREEVRHNYRIKDKIVRDERNERTGVAWTKKEMDRVEEGREGKRSVVKSRKENGSDG
jgi:hypothetical protein